MCFLAANIITDMLPSLSEEDLLDLFPGPEPFFRRRAIWRIAHVENEGEESDQVQPGTSSGLCHASTISSGTNPVSSLSSSSIINPSSNPRDQHGTSRTVQLESVKKQLLKRVQNVNPTKKKQGATPLRKRRRDIRLGSSSSQETFADDTESSGSTLILERSPPESKSSPEATEMAETQICNFIASEECETPDSRQNQARHHKVLQELYKSRPTPNKKDVAQLLDLEYQSRRVYIDPDVMKEKDRTTKILQAYHCFRDLDHMCIGSSIKESPPSFLNSRIAAKVFKKMMRHPKGHKVKQTIALMKALPDMFPSPVASPKKLEHSSEVMLHILESAEQPNTFLQSRPLLSPVVIV
ncbi:uncharacterized protein LOC110013701 isoform X2 [Oryzias latipes]|uniref:uncharacterized protein LOC110013701 isoform X2 n=1 Tax=Oryzias latipes TaxID=8090 RepID=UPI000CE21C3F|nr:uncharacterized protein LOC110013701 isoform X2 [Oryzias latipes]